MQHESQVDVAVARRNLIAFFGIALPGFFFAAFLAALTWRQMGTKATPVNAPAESRTVSKPLTLGDDERATIELFERSSPSVVHIATSQRRRDPFRRNVLDIPQGSGSGFIWDERGYVVTNFHVVAQADAAVVTMNDGREFPARLVGSAPDHDLAVLRIDAAGRLPEIEVGSSRGLRVGQRVYAIGNPFGLDQTLTTGIIGGLDREITSLTRRAIRGVIQTDAAINPGNSGGPLLDSGGRLIGVNTAIYSPSGTSAGIGFAVPVDTVNRIVPQLIESGAPERAGLGVMLAPESVAKQEFGAKGAMIQRVLPDFGAAAAGLRSMTEQAYDDIIAIDGEPVREQRDVFDILAQRKAGEVVRVRILREGRELELDVTLNALDR